MSSLTKLSAIFSISVIVLSFPDNVSAEDEVSSIQAIKNVPCIQGGTFKMCWGKIEMPLDGPPGAAVPGRALEINFPNGGFWGIPVVTTSFQTVGNANPPHKFSITHAQFKYFDDFGNVARVNTGNIDEVIFGYGVIATEVNEIPAPPSTPVYFHYIAIGCPPDKKDCDY